MNGGAYVQTSPQRGVKDQTPSQKQPPKTRESFRLLEEKKAALRDTTDYQEPPVAVGRRGTDMTMKPEFLRLEGLLSSEALGTQRSPPRHGNGLDGMYSSVIDGSVLDQLNAGKLHVIFYDMRRMFLPVKNGMTLQSPSLIKHAILSFNSRARHSATDIQGQAE